MYGAGGKAIGLQTRYHPGKQRILLVGVGGVRRGVAVRHGKMLEHAADIQPRQGVQGFQLVDSFIKPGTHRKANAAHAGVDFQVYLGLYARLDGGSGECLRVLGGKTGRGYVIFCQHCRIGRVSKAQNQNRFCDAAAAQVPSLAQAADGKRRRTGLLQGVGDGRVAVAVSVSLDNGTDIAAYRAVDIFKIAAQCCQINLRPAVLFQCKSTHKRPFLHNT